MKIHLQSVLSVIWCVADIVFGSAHDEPMPVAQTKILPTANHQHVIKLAIEFNLADQLSFLLMEHPHYRLDYPLGLSRPLTIALCLRHFEVAKVLVDHGADVTATLLDLANTLDSYVIQYLFSIGQGMVNFHQKDQNSGHTLLMKTTVECNLMSYLRKGARCSLEDTDEHGRTVLHLAISNPNVSDNFIRVLLCAGANPNAQDSREGKTPIMLALERGRLAVFQWLEPVSDRTLRDLTGRSLDGSIQQIQKTSLDQDIANLSLEPPH